MRIARSVLVVDDEVALLKVVQQTLKTFIGWDVTTSSDPEYGFEVALRANFDLFIFDFEMPAIRGNVLYNIIGKAYEQIGPEPRQLPPLLLITGHGADARARELLRRPGVRGMLPKPFDARMLLDEVEKIFPPEE